MHQRQAVIPGCACQAVISELLLQRILEHPSTGSSWLGLCWRTLRLLTFSSALGFDLLSTVEEALSGLFHSVSMETCTSLFPA